MEGVLDRCSGREVRLEGSNREPVKVGKLYFSNPVNDGLLTLFMADSSAERNGSQRQHKTGEKLTFSDVFIN